MGAPEKSQANTSSMQRVKVYRLSDDGKWDDQGTGHVAVDYIERSEELGLFVFDEEDQDTLLVHRISGDDIYRKQEDTIISWRDPEFSAEVALSFQETTGCSYIWDHICNVQRTMNFSSLNNETFHAANSELRELPSVELSTLPLILKTLLESGLSDQMRLTELILNDQDFFRKLMDLFRICEDLENIDGLHMIYKIVRGIILLNSSQIFEKIFSDELLMDIIGCLEYDPEVSNVQHHRNFLKEHVVFKEAIPIKDPLVLSKIHQTYRVGYLKDVVLARVLDEPTVANLNSIIHSNNALVVSLLKDDNTFIHELFARLKSPSISAESKKNLVYFVHEFCSLSKSLQMVQQLRLFRDLMNEGIFDIISDTLQSPDKKLVLTGTDILILFLNQDPNLLRSYVVRQEGIQLLGLLVKGMITDFGDDMHCQFLEILRSLLDSFTLSGAQRDTIIDIFYDKHLGQLVDVIVASCPSDTVAQSSGKSSGCGERAENQTVVKPEILSNISELLCFCVLHHPYRIKCNFILSNVIDKVLLLTRRREKYLVVASVRFIRATLSRADEHLINHFVKNDLFKPIVEVFVRNGDRYNLLNSAILELFDFIRKENMKLLLKYLVDSFWTELEKFEYLASIRSLKQKYEQCLENSGTRNVVAVSAEPRKRIDERALEKEEEDYFNEDSDEEDTTSVSSNTPKVHAQPVLTNGVDANYSPKSPKLVDYDDDEDDEDYKPPPKKQPDNNDDEEEDQIVLKRKPGLKEKDPDQLKKPRLVKAAKPKEIVFSSLKTANSTKPSARADGGDDDADRSSEKENNHDHSSSNNNNNNNNNDNNIRKDEGDDSSDKIVIGSDGNRVENEPGDGSKSCSELVTAAMESENGPLSRDDCSLVVPETTVNGS